MPSPLERGSPGRLRYDELAERAIVGAIGASPLVAMDRLQILAALAVSELALS